MSERLTERNANGTAKSRKSPKSSYVGTVYEEMAEIQTEILDRLCDLEDKIEQGKILELPCKIGDEKSAILPNTNVIVEGEVCEVLGCEDDCKNEDCPLVQLFERFRKYTESEKDDG